MQLSTESKSINLEILLFEKCWSFGTCAS